MQFIRKIAPLILLTLCLNSLQATEEVIVFDKHCDCSDSSSHEGTIEVFLNYRRPSDRHSIFGVYVSVMTINSERVSTKKELMQLVKGEKKNASFTIHMKPEQSLVAFVVSFDHNFATFDPVDVGVLTAVVEGNNVSIDLSEYEPDTAIGFFNLLDNL